MTLPVLAIGEALIDIVHAHDDGAVGEYAGGSPTNVAITLSRLGQTAHLFTWFGEDAHGELLVRHLDESGVILIPESQGAKRTSTSLARLDATGGAKYEFELDWNPPTVNFSQQFALVHTGSLGAAVEPGAQTVAELVRAKQPETLISYDPNMRPDLMGLPEQVLPRVKELVALSDIVKVSDEDLAWLFPDEDVMNAAQRWQGLGPALVIVTRGESGATAVSENQRITVPAPEVAVVDTVGAGDAFMGGIITYLAHHDLLDVQHRETLRDLNAPTISAMLEYAAAVAAITVSRAGANPPWLNEVSF